MQVGTTRASSRYRKVAAAILALLAVVSAPGSRGSASAREFRAADIQEEDYPTVQALLYMDKLVAERTQGRHHIRVFHSRQLGEESQTIEQTRVGAIDLDRINVAAIGDLAAPLAVLAQPFLFRSIDHLYRVIDGPIGEDILAAIEPYGFVGLTYYDSGARSIYTRAQPVRSLADLRGLRIRVQQSDLITRMMRALGAEPVTLPYGQVLTALQARLVDGAENNWPSFVTTDHYKYAGFYTLTEHTMSPEVLVMSQKAWRSLSEEDRTIFREAAAASSQFMRAKWRDLEQRSREQAEAAGVTVIRDFDRKPFEAAMAPIYEKAQRDPATAALIDRIRKTE